MGLTKKSDGRYVVGQGIADGNEYKGSAAWRDMVIQYSDTGATDKSLEYLTYLKDYALYHSALGDPCIPPNVQIWMSTANTMKAVEADDITVDGDTVKIGSCTWDGSAWSFSEPTPGGGGSSLPSYTAADKGKFLGLGDAAPVETFIVPEQTITAAAESDPALSNVDVSFFSSSHVGETATISVNGVEETATCEESGGEYDYASTNWMVWINDGTPCLSSLITPLEAGTYTVSLTTSVPAVEPKWTQVSAESPVIFKATGTAQVLPQGVLVPLDHSWTDLLGPVLEIDSVTNALMWKKPLYINIPYVDVSTGAYSYADGSYLMRVISADLTGSDGVNTLTVANTQYVLMANQTDLFIAASAK